MRISTHMTDGIAFFYSSKEAMEAGEVPGGTGFLIWTADEDKTQTHVYLVTNDHVVQASAPFHYVRINSESGKPYERATSEDEWYPHPNGDDVSVCYLGCSPLFPMSGIGYFGASQLLTEEQLDAEGAGVGDDCLMVGCFSPHPGIKANLPVVRFGNISLLPKEPVHIPERGFHQECFLVEMRSRGGFSGSPVFLLNTVAEPHTHHEIKETLGICCGHMQQWRPVKAKKKEHSAATTIDGWEMADNSGVAMVIPAWKIQQILMTEDVMDARKKAEEKHKRERWRPLAVLDTPEQTRGPEPERLAIAQDWEKAVKKALKRGKPKKRPRP